jgi:predicted transcriptional regulator
MNNNYRNTSSQYIEKFEGQFSKEDLGCTIIVNSTFQSIRDLQTLAVYSYLISKPNSWRINPKELINHFNSSKNVIYRILNNLIEINLLERIEHRSKGRFLKYEYKLYLKPYINTDESPRPHSPEAVEPEAVIEDTYKTKSVLNKESINNIYNARENEQIAPKEIKPIEYQETYFKPQEQPKPNEQFETFWSIYPLKKNKLRAQALWNDAGLNNKANEIMDKLKQQIQFDSHWIDGYIPSACNYLGQELWNDAIHKQTAKKKRNGADNLRSVDWANPFA